MSFVIFLRLLLFNNYFKKYLLFYYFKKYLLFYYFKRYLLFYYFKKYLFRDILCMYTYIIHPNIFNNNKNLWDTKNCI